MSLGIFFRGSFRQNHVPWGRLSLWKWVSGIFLEVKAAGAFGRRPTTLVVPKVEKIRDLNLPGTPRATSACRGVPLLYLLIFGRLRKIAELPVCMSVRPHGTTRLPLKGFSLNFLLNVLRKSVEKNSIFVKIWQEYRVCYMKTDLRFWSYLAQFFLVWEMFQTNAVEKFKTHILCSVTLFKKSCFFWGNEEKCGTTTQAQRTIEYGTCAMHALIPKATDVHSAYVIIIYFQRQIW